LGQQPPQTVLGLSSTPLGTTRTPGGANNDAAFGFHVAEAAGTTITDASLALSGISGLGGVDANVDDVMTLSSNGILVARLEATGAAPTAGPIAFAGVLALDVSDDLIVKPQSDVSIIDKQYSQQGVPDPAALAILGVSLLGMGVAYRRRFRK
jgi:hypothetical protein